MSNRKLKKRLRDLYKEREELLYNGCTVHDPQMAIMAISDIEFEIVALEDFLDFERRMLPFKVALYVFIVIALGILTYAIVKQ